MLVSVIIGLTPDVCRVETKFCFNKFVCYSVLEQNTHTTTRPTQCTSNFSSRRMLWIGYKSIYDYYMTKFNRFIMRYESRHLMKCEDISCRCAAQLHFSSFSLSFFRFFCEKEQKARAIKALQWLFFIVHRKANFGYSQMHWQNLSGNGWKSN